MSEIYSPLNYMGGKKKLLSQILPYFPDNINTFVDIFCGGCTVGINVKAKKIIFNDNLDQVVNLFQWMASYEPNEIIDYIERTIKENHLSEYNSVTYYAFRDKYNANDFKNPLDLFILMAYGFNNQIRFNKKGDYNIPFGERGWNDRMRANLRAFVGALNEKNVSFRKQDFREFEWDRLTPEDFVYLDPPYLVSFATYNPGWGEKEERDMLEILDNLNSRGIKFAMSNALENKGKENTILKEWIDKNGFNVVHFNASYSNSAWCRKDRDTKTDEVLIMNY